MFFFQIGIYLVFLSVLPLSSLASPLINSVGDEVVLILSLIAVIRPKEILALHQGSAKFEELIVVKAQTALL
jgi:hypothetical protein